ncbi:hypothetical protein POVWA2_044000 [Plasmodium ovale wallikeri]|uniref:Uncharacterized protein n=1 Tax=Plasmodium ovale wallikeri TaxID=864142 RepID=A0A1A8ZDX5_PLAOA|nr:hypothetical protein POVWA1_045430 [Plasmodium ovale wallikeri]SBT42546.1 hypothetical protein POVWA2_044000 [Plasmodium ovale wallikeri]
MYQWSYIRASHVAFCYSLKRSLYSSYEDGSRTGTTEEKKNEQSKASKIGQENGSTFTKRNKREKAKKEP